MGNGVSTHIVGGTEAKPHQFPWQVGIFMDGAYFCGGSVICELVSIMLEGEEGQSQRRQRKERQRGEERQIGEAERRGETDRRGIEEREIRDIV